MSIAIAIARLFAKHTTTPLTLHVGLISERGAVLAYLATADRATNDASYKEAFRFGY